MTLFIATNGHEHCLWEGELDDPAPRCLAVESEVDPIVWDILVDAVFGIPPRRVT